MRLIYNTDIQYCIFVVHFYYNGAKGAKLLMRTAEQAGNETNGGQVSKKAHLKQTARKPARAVMLQGESCETTKPRSVTIYISNARKTRESRPL